MQRTIVLAAIAVTSARFGRRARAGSAATTDADELLRDQHSAGTRQSRRARRRGPDLPEPRRRGRARATGPGTPI